ncbi:MAG: LysR substrate-binding domain-containing protein [Gemmataceae bacterium]
MPPSPTGSTAVSATTPLPWSCPPTRTGPVASRSPWRRCADYRCCSARSGRGRAAAWRWCAGGAGRSLADLQVVAELGSNEAIKEAVFRGLGLAVLSGHAIQKEVRAGQFRALTVDGLRLDREIFAVWDGRRALPIPARLFLELIGPHLECPPVP